MADFALPDDTLRALLRRDHAALAAQSAAGQGYVINAVNVQHLYHAPAVPLDVRTNEVRAMPTNEPYVPENDVTETLPDGRVVQLAAKGVPIPQAEARRLGLLKDRQQSGPQETKSQEDLNRLAAEQSAEIRALRDELARLSDQRANEQAAEAMRQNTEGKQDKPMSVRDAERLEADRARVEDAAQQRAQLEGDEPKRGRK